MNQESFFTDDEVVEMAEKVANEITQANDVDKKYYVKFDEWSKGPLAWFATFSAGYNPKGKFSAIVELLTEQQKVVAARIVADAMAKFCGR